MQDEEEAKVAIADLNGYDLEGMCIKVEVSDWFTKLFVVQWQSSMNVLFLVICLGELSI